MKNAIARFISTRDDIGVFVARLALSIVFIPHGAGKLLGLFGGSGFSATMEYFIKSGMPATVAFLIIMGESLGSMALLVGFFGRFMAFGIGMIMMGAIFLVHSQYGFFMNWFGNQKGEGFEYHLLALGLALLLNDQGEWKILFGYAAP